MTSCELVVPVEGRVHRTSATPAGSRLRRVRWMAVRPERPARLRRPARAVTANLYLGAELLQTDPAGWWNSATSAGSGCGGCPAAPRPTGPEAVRTRVTGRGGRSAERAGPSPVQSVGLCRCDRPSSVVCGWPTPAARPDHPAGPQLALTEMSGDLARPWTVEELARLAAAVAVAVAPARFGPRSAATPLGWLTRSRAERFAVICCSGRDDTVAGIGPPGRLARPQLRQSPLPSCVRGQPVGVPAAQHDPADAPLRALTRPLHHVREDTEKCVSESA